MTEEFVDNSIDLSAVASFAAGVAESIPEKKIVSPRIQTISGLNLFRDPAEVYLPVDRFKNNIQEKYETPNMLDIHVGIKTFFFL